MTDVNVRRRDVDVAAPQTGVIPSRVDGEESPAQMQGGSLALCGARDDTRPRSSWSALHLLLLAALFTSCASLPRVPDPKVAFANPGPYAVVEYDVDWFDAARNRHVPVHFYAPQTDRPMPVVIFSHGLGNSRTGYAYLGRQWASYGYLSVNPQHEGADIDVTRHGLWHVYRVGFDRRNWERVPDDIHFVIDQLVTGAPLPPELRGHVDTSRIAVAGHSLGAYGALAVGGLRVLFPDGHVANFRDPRVKAAIPISMSENFNKSSYTDIVIPMLHITGTRDSSILYGTLPRKRRVPYNSISRTDQYLLVIRGANHSTFSDEESPSNLVAHDAVRAATVTFLNAYLRDDQQALAMLRGGGLAAELHDVAKFSTKDVPVRIGKITIKTEPLFNAQEANQGAFYRAANFVAVQTHEPLIRKFLLFHEGEPLDEARLRESERNLRALDFLKSASVTAGPPHDGVVDVVVATQDEWTTDVNADFSNEGGDSIYDVDVTQKNIAGTSGEVDLRLAKGRERRTNSIEFLDPAAFGRYFAGDLYLAKSSDGHEIKLAADRPLFSYRTPATFDGSIDHLVRNEHIYALGQESGVFRQHHDSFTVTPGIVLQRRPAGTIRLLGGIDFQRDSFRPILGAPPANRDFRFLEIGFDMTSLRFVTLSHVDYGLREQDFPLGFHGALIGGRSTRGISRIRSEASYGRLYGHSLLVTKMGASTRTGPTNRNALLSSDTRWIVQQSSAFPLTFIARARLDAGRDLDRDMQFFADGQNGLRAYPNFAFEGTRRFVFNAEERWSLGRELLQIFEPGAAIFVDSGNATNRSLLHTGLRTDFGAGVRFGIERLESAMLRFDVAYALNSSPFSRRGIVFSFATEQAF